MKTKRFIVTLICLVQSVIYSVSYSKDYYVKVDGTGDGSSWEKAMSGDAFSRLLPEAPRQSFFYLAAGTYTPAASSNKTFFVNDDVTIIGGFPQDAKKGDVSDPNENVTCLTYAKEASGSPILRFKEGNISFNLKGVTIKGGYIALYSNKDNKITLSGCVLDNAPIMASASNKVSIENTTIKNLSRKTASFPQFSLYSIESFSLKKTVIRDIDSMFTIVNKIEDFVIDDVDAIVSSKFFDVYVGSANISRLKVTSSGLWITASSSPTSIINISESEIVSNGNNGDGIHVYGGYSFNLSKSLVKGFNTGVSSSSTNSSLDNVEIYGGTGGSCFCAPDYSNVYIKNSQLYDANEGVKVYSGSLVVENSVISGNSSYGIGLTTGLKKLTLKNNIIGLSADASAKKGNGTGVFVRADSICIDGNIISGNKGLGVDFNQKGAFCEIKNNYIGTNKSFEDVGNGGSGINLVYDGAYYSASMNPSSLKEANYIGFNGENGVIAYTYSSEISNNYIGVTPDGRPMPNGKYGIYVNDGHGLLNIKYNHLGYNGTGDIYSNYSVISHNIFHGNKTYAIETTRDVPSIKITNEKMDGFYIVVEGIVQSDNPVEIQLYYSDGGKQNALALLGTDRTDASNNAFSIRFPLQNTKGKINYSWVVIEKKNSESSSKLFGPQESTIDLSEYQKEEYFVKVDGSGTGDGSSWENAMSGEQFAKFVPYAVDNTTFHLAAGNYTPLLTYGYGNYGVKSSIKIIGGYPADAKSGAISKPQENITMMDGDPMPIKAYLFNSYDEALKIELDGIYMRNVVSAIEGGRGSVVVARNCEFSNAPIVLSKSESLTLINCVVKDITESSEKSTPLVLDSLKNLIISSTTINNIYGHFCEYKASSYIKVIEMDNVNISIDTIYNMGYFDYATVKNSTIISQGITAYTGKNISFEGVKISSTENARMGLFVYDNKHDISLSLKDVTIEGSESGITSFAPHVHLDKVNFKGKQGTYGLYAIHSSDVLVSNSTFSNTERGIEVAGENLRIENSIISGNSKYGIKSYGTLKKIELYNNIIGLTKDESEILANGIGAYISADTLIAEGNVISGNTSSGIQISNMTIPSTQSTIEKNYIGVKRDGSLSPNGGYGIEVLSGNRKDLLNISNNYFGGNEPSDIVVGNASSVISQNVFYGNKELAINSIIEKPIINSVSFSNGGYVVKGEIVNGLDKIKNGVTVELFTTNKEPQSALKYLKSTSEVVDGKFSIEISELPVDTSCLAAVVIFNAESAATNDKYSSELSDPYCLCELTPEIMADTVKYGVYSKIFGDKYNPFIVGEVRDTILTVENGCQKSRIESLSVLPFDNTLGYYYVKENGTGDGSSWENAMSGKQFTAVCGSVPDGTTFYLAEGNYEPMKVYGYSGFYLNSDIHIIGGYPADAKTGAKREKGKYSTIDASGLGVKSYLFRRLNYNDTLNIYLEGLAMLNVMNAIEGDPGSEILVEDCLFDNAPLVFNKSSHVEITNSTIQNISKESELTSALEIDSVAIFSIKDSKFKSIDGNVFTWSSWADSLILENVHVEANTMQIGAIGSGSFNKVASNVGFHCDSLTTDLSIFESSFPSVYVNGGKIFKINKSVIEGEGVSVSSDSVYVDNTKITNKVPFACLYTTDARVKVKRSILSGGKVGVSYRNGSVDIEDSYIYSNTEAGIVSAMPTGNASSFKPLILKNNYIGLNERGEVAGNKIGVSVLANKFIAIGNVISGNDSIGIEFKDVNETVIENNYIGTDKQYRNLGNGGCGIDLHKSIGEGTGSVKLSPSSFDKANVIGFNGGDGVIVSTGTPSDESYISHNYIGVAPDGTKIPNMGYGVRIKSGYNSLPAILVENHIGYNEAGDVSEGEPFKISKNIFHGNELKAIDKTYQSFQSNFDPIIKSVSIEGDNYIVSGVTAEHAIVDVELFGTNDTHQSALVYLGTVSLSTSDWGDFSFTVPMEKMSQDSLTCFVATVWSESYHFTTELSAPYCLCASSPEIVEETVMFGQPSKLFGDKYDSYYVGERRDTIISTENGCSKIRIESFIVTPLDSTEYFVKEGGSGDGSSWEKAMSGEAFAAYLPYAPKSSTFHVAAGTYHPVLNLDLQKNENSASKFFMVKNDVTIIGGYPIDAKDSVVPDPDKNLTLFSGDIMGNDSLGITDDNTTYVFYIDKDAKSVKFEGVDIAHSKNGICTDLAPQTSIVVHNSRLNNCDAAVKVSLMLSSLELDNVKFDSNINAVSSGTINNTTVKNSTFEHHTGTPLKILSSGEVSITNSIFDGNLRLPIVQGSASDVTITSSTISNTSSQGKDEPIIQSSVVTMVNNTLVGNEQGRDWIKTDSLVMYHNTLLGINGIVGGIFTNSEQTYTITANILGYDSLPSGVSELLSNNIVGLTKGELPQNADERLLSAEQMSLLLHNEQGKYLLANRGGTTPVVALRRDTLKNGISIRTNNVGLETDQRGEIRPDMTCMGSYEYLRPIVLKFSDTICFGETIYQKHGFDIVLKDSISGVFDFDSVVPTLRADTFYHLTLTIKPQLILTDVKIDTSTCISNPNGKLSFVVEGWDEAIAYMSYDGEAADTLLPIEVTDAAAKFRVDNVKDKSFTIYVENRCGRKFEDHHEINTIPDYSISISEISTENLRCSYSRDGVIEVIISGGHKLSEFNMKDSMTIAKKNVPSMPDTTIIDNLGPGIYSFSYRSTVEGCADGVNAIHPIKVPEPIIFKNSIANATCYGQASGELDIVPLRKGDSIIFVDDKLSVNYARAVLNEDRTVMGYLRKFADIDSIGFSLVSLDSSVNMYGKTKDQFFKDALEDAVDLAFPMDSMSKHDSLYTKIQYPQSWLGYTAMYPGTYKVKVRDSKGCYFEQSFEIKNPEHPLSVTMDHEIDKCDADKRRVQLRASGGWAPYQFIVTKSKEWGNSDDNDNKDLSGAQGGVTIGQNFEPDTTLKIVGDSYLYTSDILPIDTINIMVMDKKGCVDTVGKNIIVDANIIVLGEEVYDKCAQPKDHSIKVNLGPEISGKPHSYKIRFAQRDTFQTVLDFKTDAEGNDIISGLPSGRIGVFAYADGCSGYSTVDIAGDTSLSYIPYVAMKLDSVESCPDAATGALELKLYGSYPPYKMYLDDISEVSLVKSIDLYDTTRKEYAQMIDQNPFISTVMDKLRLRDLPGGNHTLKVVDSEGCQQNIDYNFKVLPPVEISAAASPVCPGEEFARVYVETVSGGKAPYLYALDGSTDFNDESFKKVLAGTTHSISVKDANGCVQNSGLIQPNTKQMSEVSADCMVTNWHSIDDVVVFVDISSTGNFSYDSVSFSIKEEDLPKGVSYEEIDPDYFRYGLMPGDTVEWINGKSYYGPLWSIPDEIVSCVLPENEYEREHNRLEQVVQELENSLLTVIGTTRRDTIRRDSINRLLTSQTEKLSSICTKEMVLDAFTTELLDKISIERMKFIRLATDTVIQNSDSALFSYPFTHTLYVGGCDITVEYNGENGKRPINVEDGNQHFANLNTKDILDLIASPNPAKPQDNCTIAVTLKSKKDVYCDVYGLNGGVSTAPGLSIKADSDAWESSDSNYICKFNVKLSETAIVRVRTASDAASVVVLVNPSDR